MQIMQSSAFLARKWFLLEMTPLCGWSHCDCQTHCGGTDCSFHHWGGGAFNQRTPHATNHYSDTLEHD